MWPRVEDDNRMLIRKKKEKRQKESTKKSQFSLCKGRWFNSINILNVYMLFFPQQFFLFRNLPFRDTCTCAQLYAKGFHDTTVYNCEKQKQPNYLPVQKWFKYYGTSKLYIIIHIKPSNIFLHKSLQGTLLHEKQQVAEWYTQWVKPCLSVRMLTCPHICPPTGVGLA